ncbi:MAG: hypothetical protein AAF799_47500 [Myxococcota bacterium]
MKTARYVFSTFSVLFLPLYFLMLWKYWDEFQREEDPLAQALDLGIVGFGVLFLVLQVVMLRWVWKPERSEILRRLFWAGLAVWFIVEVVLSYWWCFVTGADPLVEHTPFVFMFLCFNAAQFWALRKIGVMKG